MPRPDIAESMVGIRVPVLRRGFAGAIPYFAWANRDVSGMRVWLPR